MVYVESIAQDARRDLATLVPTGILQDFYLAGGTGLALHFGHRESIDLDFFRTDIFDENAYLNKISAAGSYSLDKKETGTLTGRFNSTQLSLFHYPYELIEPTTSWEGIEIASVLDIACMKLDAASTRGTKKDFIDLYVITHQGGYALPDLLAAFERKYARVQYNLMHIKKSLVFFADAKTDPMPRMHIPLEWKTVTDFFEHDVPKL